MEPDTPTTLKIAFPADLPVSRHRTLIREAVADHQVVVVCGDTGSGKTTQLPKIALELGLGEKGKIGCTQPRRIAATSVAKRVADELKVSLGQEVGYQIRFQDNTSSKTVVKFMTDGILLAETRGDPRLKQYEAIIVDEAHERSLNIDFILGYLKRLLPSRPDLKIIISSATLDAELFSDFFGEAPVLQVEGRTFPVEDEFQPPLHSRERLADQIARASEWLREIDPLGDTLIFLPGEREIQEAEELLHGRKYPNTEVMSLFGRQAGGDQQRIFQPRPRSRRLILATNVAETSLTIPDIRFVVDSGLARVNRYDPRAGIQRLQVEQISQASARQRRGRCGRVSEGICVRLYDEEEFEEMRPYSDPEILRSNLAGVVLQMEHLNLGDPLKFPFVDPPQPKRVSEAYRVLEEIGAIHRKRGLTEVGETLARLPLDPRVGRILIEADREECLAEALILASALTIQDPRERPKEAREAADQAHARFRDQSSDFTGWLKIWFALQENRKSNNSLRRFCAKNFLNYRRVQEWFSLHRELSDTLRRLGWKWDRKKTLTDPDGSFHEPIHRAVLAAIPSQIGLNLGKKQGYKGARDQSFSIHPGSGIFRKAPTWIMAFEMVETAKLYARNGSRFDPAWMEKVAPHVCRHRYTKPHWVPEQGAVYAEEAVIAFGLPLVEKRRIHLGKIDPPKAREIFIWEALVHQNTRSPLPALTQNRLIIERVQSLEHKMRRRDGLLFPQAIFEFYSERLPQDLCTQKAFEKWASSQSTETLELTLEDCMIPQMEPIDESAFPENLNGYYPVTYRHDPSLSSDGLTISIPLADLPRLPDWFGDWLVPGFLEEKLQFVLRSIDKHIRQLLPPMANVSADFLAEWEGYEPECGLLEAILSHIESFYETTIAADAFSLGRIPEYLKARFEVLDDDGNVMKSGRDLQELRAELAPQLESRFSTLVEKKRQARPIRSYDFTEMLEPISLDSSTSGFIGLLPTKTVPEETIFPAEFCARWFYPVGLSTLVRQLEKDRIGPLEKVLFSDSRAQPQSPPSPSPARDSFNSLEAAFGGAPTKTSVKPKPTKKSEYLSADSAALLVRVGAAPHRNRSDLVTLVLLESLGNPLPLSGAEVREKLQTADLFETAIRLCSILERILDSVRSIEPILQRSDPGYEDSLLDAREQFRHLLRAGWIAESFAGGLPRIEVQFRGLSTRLTRMFGGPPDRDYQKMNRFYQEFEKLKSELVVPDSPKCCGHPHPSEVDLEFRALEAQLRLKHFAPEFAHELRNR